MTDEAKRAADLSREPAESEILHSPSGIELVSLAPKYDRDQHETYVAHLERAVGSPRVQNIALTGRYGSGKSSILDEFQQRQDDHKKVLRISINTLGLDAKEGITNRIQKELVKQLIYRAEPGDLTSKYGRAREISKWRMAGDALGVSVAILFTLWFFGAWPSLRSLWGLPNFLSGLAFAVTVFSMLCVVRWGVRERLVSEVAAGGASIKLEKKESADTYFDEYLNEIVEYFEDKGTEIVIFEDLDRFNNVEIFDSLRELNTLINALPQIVKRGQPVRFVYAIKDSLFERIGDESPAAKTQALADEEGPVRSPAVVKRLDAAREEVERANRTKFFEMVIPVVPFLSHNNARDLLREALKRHPLPDGDEISRSLLDVVARHTTDMRLLENICNEFVVFAERLLWCDESIRAPEITADKVFALVVYKNFHMGDFEGVSQRTSDLDELSAKRDVIVAQNIATLQIRRRQSNERHNLWERRATTAEQLGKRLDALAESLPNFRDFTVNGERCPAETSGTVEFWSQVHEIETITLNFKPSTAYIQEANITRSQIEALLPEALDANIWNEPSAGSVDSARAEINEQIASLRGADFASLATDRDLKFDDGQSFADVIEETLPSELARDLVRHGFIDRFYAEYASPFYGKFVGVDVANFFRTCVWPNEMNYDFSFTSAKALQNVMEQAPQDFTSSRSAFHPALVDHLLDHDGQSVDDLVEFIQREESQERDTFLMNYLSDEGSQGTKLAGRLAAAGWLPLLDLLAELETTDVHRAHLLDAALLSVDEVDQLGLKGEAVQPIIDLHARMTAFTQVGDQAQAKVIREVIRRLDFEIPRLEVLAGSLLPLVVDDGLYALSGDNLREALGSPGAFNLDTVVEHESVWRMCAPDLGTYLNLVAADTVTGYAVEGADTLVRVVEETHETWAGDEMTKLLELSAPEVRLTDITAIVEDCWAQVVAAGRMWASARNVLAYCQFRGVDDSLASFLGHGGSVTSLEAVDELDADSAYRLAVELLSAHPALTADERINLAVQVLQGHPEAPEMFSVEDLKPRSDDRYLLSRLLEKQFVKDSAETFAYFLSEGGWAAIALAFEVSTSAHKFLTPELVADPAAVPYLLNSNSVTAEAKQKIMQNLDTFIPDDDAHGDALRAAARFAFENQVEVTSAQLARMARAAKEPGLLLRLLVQNRTSATEIISILPELGNEYSGFAQPSGSQFTITRLNGVTDKIVQMLADAGLVTRPRRGRQPGKHVVQIV